MSPDVCTRKLQYEALEIINSHNDVFKNEKLDFFMRMLCSVCKHLFCFAHWEAPLDATFQGTTESNTDVMYCLACTTDPL